MPLIALDARKYFDFGIGTYIRHLVEEFDYLKRGGDIMLLLAPKDARSITLPEGWKSSIIPYGKYSIGEMILLGGKVAGYGVSGFHCPHYTLPFRLKIPSIVTIHDLIHLRFPQFFSSVQRAYSYGMIRHALRDSRFIITDTEFTKRDILQSFDVDEKKITPIHLGVAERFAQKVSEDDFSNFSAAHRLGGPYVLFVGNTKPHKGLPLLVEAFKKVVPFFSELELVFAGGELSHNKNLATMVSESDIKRKVKSLGHLSDDDLRCAYHGASMVVLPSLYEGFGLPALEAMACGTPVIVSNAGSLPEIVGDAAIVCESGNADAFADAILSLLRDAQLRKGLIEKGKKHSGGFLWRTTAQKTLNLYDKI